MLNCKDLIFDFSTTLKGYFTVNIKTFALFVFLKKIHMQEPQPHHLTEADSSSPDLRHYLIAGGPWAASKKNASAGPTAHNCWQQSWAGMGDSSPRAVTSQQSSLAKYDKIPPDSPVWCSLMEGNFTLWKAPKCWGVGVGQTVNRKLQVFFVLQSPSMLSAIYPVTEISYKASHTVSLKLKMKWAVFWDESQLLNTSQDAQASQAGNEHWCISLKLGHWFSADRQKNFPYSISNTTLLLVVPAPGIRQTCGCSRASPQKQDASPGIFFTS